MKKLISFGIGIALLAFPLIVSAQAVSTGNAGLIVALEQLVATLTKELESLIAARGQSATPSVSTASNSTAPTTNSSLQTYTNSQFGLSFQYPSTFKIIRTQALPDGSIELTIATPDSQGSFYILAGPNVSGYVQTVCSQDPHSILGSTATASATTTINGIPFLFASDSSTYSTPAYEGANARFSENYVYKAIQNNICYSINTEISEASSPANQLIANQLDEIIQSLEITAPQVAISVSTTTQATNKASFNQFLNVMTQIFTGDIPSQATTTAATQNANTNAPMASIDQSSLSVMFGNSLIVTGSALNVSSVAVAISTGTGGQGYWGTTVFNSGAIAVVNGRWSTTVPSSAFQNPGAYTINVGASAGSGVPILQTTTLTVNP